MQLEEDYYKENKLNVYMNVYIMSIFHLYGYISQFIFVIFYLKATCIFYIFKKFCKDNRESHSVGHIFHLRELLYIYFFIGTILYYYILDIFIYVFGFIL